jgi:hypothetical protein
VISDHGNTVVGSNGQMFYESLDTKTMHELVGHGIPNMVGGGTGNAVDDENNVRAENGLPLRPKDESHVE